ncbi:MAG: pantoate--beta-alanine ligase, partial [Candidatus Sumerlaeota bacterium]|nr:pantoate--beta-alanine ligase [Candidatus Sumerlaeota bacterium]
HFRGVLTIVAKLFNIVQPDFAVFGWKDAQQIILIRKMVEDFNFPLKIEGIETVREADGLAISSRNVYLSPAERAQAPAIQRGLAAARDAALRGVITRGRLLEQLAKDLIISGAPLARIDYIRCVSISRIIPLARIEKGNTMLAAAVYFGKARLIDNIRF